MLAVFASIVFWRTARAVATSTIVARSSTGASQNHALVSVKVNRVMLSEPCGVN